MTVPSLKKNPHRWDDDCQESALDVLSYLRASNNLTTAQLAKKAGVGRQVLDRSAACQAGFSPTWTTLYRVARAVSDNGHDSAIALLAQAVAFVSNSP
jgi:transcriptional regulator with XRE-family HTH domain